MIGLEELNRVLSLLSWWLMTIKSHNAVGFFDINKVAEGVALKLLNEIYDYQLENLNYEKSNYPGIDLGDNINKIGFQITSRNDSRKIYDNLEKFVKAPAKIYSNGIRFLILSQGKKPRMKENIYKKIYPDLRPEQHILNADELIKKIHQFYDTDSKKFYRIKEILELEIAGKAMKKENIKLLRSKLFEGSKAYYQKLTGINGRFKHLRISDIILTQPKNQWIDQHVIAEGEEDEQRNVLTALPKLWGKSCKHTVILGEGGMGKTVSLIRIWNEYLEKSYEKIPIPVFIALNEYNQISDASKRENFIVSLIKKNYGDQMVSHEDIWEIMKAPLQEEDGFKPSLILLLDGFNEITHDKRELLIEMRHLIEQAKGVQIVVTSRYDVRGNFNWMEFHLLKLMELEDKQVDLYLQEQGTPAPGSVTEGDKNRIRQLIKNPMMLTLYASTCEVQRDHLLDNNCDFKKQVGTPGELLWNFLEAQVARLPERLGDDSGKQWFYKFLLKFLLPAIGYEMEIAGQFEFKRNELNEIIQKYCIRFSQEDFFLAFPGYEQHIDDLNVGECPGIKEKIQRRAKIVKIVCEELLMMVNEGNSFRFLHQNFRDFFAAQHLLNEAEISLSKCEIPGVFKERILDFFIRQLLGEIQGEHRSKPYLVEEQGWKIVIDKESLLHRVLDLCRGKFGEEVGYAVCNIVMIWKEVRGELSGADLSGLDLSGIPLNGVSCSLFYQAGYLGYLAAVFDGSRVHENNLLPRGHTGRVHGAVYSPDGEKILSASYDQTIKEWDAGTGQCVKTLAGHTSIVSSAVYSPDGKKILSTSWDQTIKEWDAATGKCLKTHKKEDKPVIPGYPPNHKNIKLKTEENKIYVQDTSDRGKGRVLINIPGLFIQGCSFKNLEKGSQWSKEGLEILRQYHAIVSVGQ